MYSRVSAGCVRLLVSFDQFKFNIRFASAFKEQKWIIRKYITFKWTNNFQIVRYYLQYWVVKCSQLLSRFSSHVCCLRVRFSELN